MRGPERVININISEFGKFLREIRIILFFLFMKAKVLQKDDLLARGTDRRLDIVADALIKDQDLLL